MRPPPRLRSQTSPGTASHGHLGRSIFVVSDATGETAERVVRAALRQFDLGELPIDLRVFPHLRHEHDVDTVVAEARAVGALLVSTLVRAEERSLLHKKCDERGVQCVDLIGSLLGRLASYFSVQPRGIPGLLHTVSDEYYQRMEAIEFTVQSDDGRDPQSLQRADLVLVGISRTSKTPLSIYLAQKGYKVANVPLVLDLPPPPELFELQGRHRDGQDAPATRVFALTIQPDALLQIRRERLLRLHMTPDTSYGQRDYILREIYAARALYSAHPEWPVIDITGKAIEETAADILRIYTRSD